MWDAIYKAFHVNAVLLFLARKIYPSAFTYVFKQIGVLGYQFHEQFFPPATESTLQGCRHKAGLGHHDMRFTREPNNHLIKAASVFAENIPKAYKRMQQVRPHILGYITGLANPRISADARNDYFYGLQHALKRNQLWID